jgi:hypothetical protein
LAAGAAVGFSAGEGTGVLLAEGRKVAAVAESVGDFTALAAAAAAAAGAAEAATVTPAVDEG